MAQFNLHIGIDYSGAATSASPLAGLQVFVSQRDTPVAARPPLGPGTRSQKWTRKLLADWLIEQAWSKRRFVAGIDHGFSFPQTHFERFQLCSWSAFLEHFSMHWPTHRPATTVESLRRQTQRSQALIGSPSELRLTEKWTSNAKGVFLFDVQGSVAKSTFAGIPWLNYLRQMAGSRLHFWPFDGWLIPPRRSVVCEVFPSIFRRRYPRDQRTADEQDAFSIASWLSEMDQRRALEQYFSPPLTAQERKTASLEGWILGVM